MDEPEAGAGKDVHYLSKIEDAGISHSSLSVEEQNKNLKPKAADSNPTDLTSKRQRKSQSDRATDGDLPGACTKVIKLSSSEGRCSSSSVESSSKAGRPLSAAANASSTIQHQYGTGEPASNDVMAKMMAVMSKGGPQALLGVSKKGIKGVPPNEMSHTAKGGMMTKGGIPNMAAMMAKGGMPDMAAMMVKGGIPDMMAMMGSGGGMPDMMAMMGAGGPGPMGMKKLMDCIIEVTFARPDSEESDDDDDNVTIEIPCQYCTRFFTSQMLLKTHILVAHDHQDTSVLNIRKLVLDSKGRCGVKEKSRRKQSRDSAASAASSPVEAKPPDTLTKPNAALSQVVMSGADAERGVKRTRSNSKEQDVAHPGAASSLVKPPSADNTPKSCSAPTGSGADPSGCVDSSQSETRKRKPQLHSQCSDSGESSAQITPKRSKTSGWASKTSDLDDSKQTAEALESAYIGECEHTDVKSQDGAKLKKDSTAKDDPSLFSQGPLPQRGNTYSRKEKEVVLSSDKDSGSDSQQSRSNRSLSHKNRQSSNTDTAAGTSDQEDVSPLSAKRRSLRSRKSR